MSRKFLKEVLKSHDRIFSVIQGLEADLLTMLRDVSEIYNKEMSVIRHHLDIFLRIYEEELSLHFKSEEEAIFPYAKDQNLVGDLIKEHIVISDKIRELKKKREADPREAIDILKNIIDILKQHILKENTLYNEMSEYLTIKEMNEIRDRIKKIYSEDDAS